MSGEGSRLKDENVIRLLNEISRFGKEGFSVLEIVETFGDHEKNPILTAGYPIMLTVEMKDNDQRCLRLWVEKRYMELSVLDQSGKNNNEILRISIELNPCGKKGYMKSLSVDIYEIDENIEEIEKMMKKYGIIKNN